MTASVDFLSIMVTIALAIMIVAPIGLFFLLYQDWKNGELW